MQHQCHLTAHPNVAGSSTSLRCSGSPFDEGNENRSIPAEASALRRDGAGQRISQHVDATLAIDLGDETVERFLFGQIDASLLHGEDHGLRRSPHFGLLGKLDHLRCVLIGRFRRFANRGAGRLRRRPTNRIQAARTSGSRVKASPSMAILRGAQSRQNISTITGLNRSGVPTT